MADKVGTSGFFVRIILVGVLLTLLFVGALLSIFYHGDGAIFVLISLVVIPAVGLLLMYIIYIATILKQCKLDIDKEEFWVPPLSSAPTIVIYGSEFSDPYYRQLTMPHFVGKPLQKQHKKSVSDTDKNKPNKRLNYTEYADSYNGVTQGQMSFGDWVDVLGDETNVNISESDASSQNKLFNEAVENAHEKAVLEVMEAVTSSSNIQSVDIENTAISSDTIDASETVKNTAKEDNKSSIERNRAKNKSSGNSRAPKQISANVVQKHKIRTHTKPIRDKRDDYVFQYLHQTDTNRPIKSQLAERFSDTQFNNIHSASRELLNKMRRDNIRR